ncbi:MAG: ABC transporter permease [Bacteroidetes bacterium 4572_77]|nr:MAG: ABC transporter permease [Bacteroidetes bacterium 4572_77]
MLLFWGYNFLKGKDVFTSERIFYAQYFDVSGLAKADPVFINGLRAGQVKTLYFEPDNSGRVMVVLQITQDFPLPNNSIAKIISTDLMGTKAISLFLGNSPDLLFHGDTIDTSIESTLQEQMEQTIAPLKNKAESLLTSVDDIISNLQIMLNSETTRNIKNSLSHLEKSLNNMESVTGNLDSLVADEKSSIEKILANAESITANLRDNNDHLSAILTNFHQISDSLAAAQMATTIRNANSAIVDFSTIMNKMNSGQGSMGQLLNNDTLYFELEKSARDLNLLLEDLKENPKKYVKLSIF